MAAILEKMAATRAYYTLYMYINNYQKWIPRPPKPGYSHQSHNCMSTIGRDMMKIGWNGSHFEKHGCHLSYITYLSQTNSSSNLFSGPENLDIAPSTQFCEHSGLRYRPISRIGLAAILKNKLAAMQALVHFYV